MHALLVLGGVVALILVLVCGGFLLVWTLAAGCAARALHPDRREIEERDRLRRVGLAGRARVLRFEDAGTSPAGEPMFHVDLAVEVGGREPYQVRHRTAVRRLWGWRLRAGLPLSVLVDPEDPDRLVVEWWRPRPRRAVPRG